MPFPTAAAIAAGSTIAGGAIGAASVGNVNRKSQRFHRGMYDLQRDHALTDWHRNNWYNHPVNQRARLEAAGLSPALMYGNSASGGNASPVRSSSVGNPQFKSPDFGFIANAGMQYLNTMVDLDIKQAQHDNLRQQNTNLKTENLLKLSAVDRSKFDLNMDMILAQTQADTKRQILRGHMIDNEVKLRADERAQITTDMGVKESLERILNYRASRAKTRAEEDRIRQMIKSLKYDTQIKRLDYEFYQDGIRPNDSIIARMLHRLYTRGMDYFGNEILENYKGTRDMFQFYNR